MKNDAYITYLINKQVWPGYNEVYWYLNQKWELTRAAGHWYTNLPVKDRPKHNLIKIISLRKIPEKYKKYDDDKVLLVDHNYIPLNYKKPFAISVFPILSGLLEKDYEIVLEKRYTPYIDGKEQYVKVLVQKV